MSKLTVVQPQAKAAKDASAPKGQTGRPRKKVNIAEFKALASRGATNEEIAAYFGVNPRTIERRRRQAAYAEAFAEGRAAGSLKVRTWIYESAEKGNIAARIFLYKVVLGFRELSSVEVSGTNGGALNVALVDQILNATKQADDGERKG